jgi:hypothetical protein
MSESNQRPKVTIEELLRLKRAERPAPEFWANFETELRQKQLTALLHKRTWWREIPHFLTRHAYLPVGATAILAFTLVSVKYSTSGQLAQASGPAMGATAASIPAAPEVAVTSPLVNRSVSAPVETVAPAPVAVARVSPGSSDAAIELMPLLVAPRAVEKPSARLLADSLNQAGSDMPDDVMGSRLSSPARSQTVSARPDELASLPTDSSRRSRLIAQYSDRHLSPSPTPPSVVRERLVRRLGTTEPDSRLDLRGDADSFGTPMPQIVALRF